MTDFEIAELFTEYFALMQTQIINYATVLFAFLLAGYLIASKLQRVMATVIIVIFTAFAFDALMTTWFLAIDVVELQLLMRERVANGSQELAFHAAAREDFNMDLYTVTAIRVLTGVLAYIGAIWFFFHQRRLGLENDLIQQ